MGAAPEFLITLPPESGSELEEVDGGGLDGGGEGARSGGFGGRARIGREVEWAPP